MLTSRFYDGSDGGSHHLEINLPSGVTASSFRLVEVVFLGMDLSQRTKKSFFFSHLEAKLLCSLVPAYLQHLCKNSHFLTVK